MIPSKEKLIETLLNKKNLWNRYAQICYKKNKQIDLSFVCLRDKNLQNRFLCGADMSYADMSYAIMISTIMISTTMIGTIMISTIMISTTMIGTIMIGADMRRANMSGATMRRANFDFSCWPLWCGSLNVKMTSKLFCQLLYHAAKPNYIGNDKDIKNLLKNELFIKVCNKFSRSKKCGKIELKRE